MAVVVGLAAGLGAYTFVYARGYSYLTNDPSACGNCHVMREQYDGWGAGASLVRDGPTRALRRAARDPRLVADLRVTTSGPALAISRSESSNASGF